MMKFKNVYLMCVFTRKDATTSVASILTNPAVTPSMFPADIPPVSHQHLMSLANLSDLPPSRSILNTKVQPCVSQPQYTCRAQNLVPSNTLTHSTATATNFRLPSSTPVRAGETTNSLMLTIVKQSAEIEEQLLFNTRLLQDLTKTHMRNSDRDRFCQQPCQLPLHTYESVLDVERKLKSKECYSQLVNYLSVIGGATVKDFISRTMETLLDPELARTFVWVGRLIKKHAFRPLELKIVLREDVRKNPLTSRATVAEVEYEMKNWLKGAPDRHGGRAERAKKKARQRSRNFCLECCRSRSLRRYTVSPSPSRLNSNGHECNRMTPVRRPGNETSRWQIVSQCASTRQCRLNNFHGTFRRLISLPRVNGSSTQSRSTSVVRQRAGRYDVGTSRRPTDSPSARGSCRPSRSPQTRGKSSSVQS